MQIHVSIELEADNCSRNCPPTCSSRNGAFHDRVPEVLAFLDICTTSCSQAPEPDSTACKGISFQSWAVGLRKCWDSKHVPHANSCQYQSLIVFPCRLCRILFLAKPMSLLAQVACRPRKGEGSACGDEKSDRLQPRKGR